MVANGESRSPTPTFRLRIWKALAISSARRGDHEGRDRAIQVLAILNVPGASKISWQWNASQAERHAVDCFSSLGARCLRHNVSALRASQSHRAISRQAMLCNETGRRRPHTKAAWQLFPPEGSSCLAGRKNLLWFTDYPHCALSHHGPTGLDFQHLGFGVQSLSTPPWGNLTPLAPDTTWTVPVAGPTNRVRITVVSIGYRLFGWVVHYSYVPACNGQWIA